MAKRVGVVGGGPAGLMAAEVLSASGLHVCVFEAMPTVGRKLLMAGKSGLNLTHSEAHDKFKSRFSAAEQVLTSALDAFDAQAVREWAAGLGVETFMGSSGRIFPESMKASPLLRAWLARLEEQGVELHVRQRWAGFEGPGLIFETAQGSSVQTFDAVVLAVGGASWPRLGSDASWVPWIQAQGVTVNPFRPANCGFDVQWSDVFRETFAGKPVKSVTATSPAGSFSGEFVLTSTGVEGSLIYSHSAALRDMNKPVLMLDLAPAKSRDRLVAELERQSRKVSFSNRLRKVGLEGVKAGLVREFTSQAVRGNATALAEAVKALELPLLGARPIAEAISVAGGVALDAVDPHFMLESLSGVFVAGEMLDWEAPTGGYLLSACLATGRSAARGVLDFLES